MLRNLAALASTAALTTAALAADPLYGARIKSDPVAYSYTGVYLDVAGGRGFTTGETTVGGLTVDSLAGTGWLGQARVGFDWQPTGSPLVLGVFGGYGLGRTEFNVDAVGPGNLLGASLEKTWHTGGRVGLASGRGLLYVGGAWQRAEFEASWVGCEEGRCRFSDTLDGWKALVGVEYALTPQVSLGLEYGHTWFGDVRPDEGVKVNLQDDEVWLRLRWRPAAGLFN